MFHYVKLIRDKEGRYVKLPNGELSLFNKKEHKKEARYNVIIIEGADPTINKATKIKTTDAFEKLLLKGEIEENTQVDINNNKLFNKN